MKHHRKISFVKSAIRIFGFLVLMFDPTIAAVYLIIAELLGIAEEIQWK